RLEHLLPAEREQLLREIGTPLDRGLQRFGILARRTLLGEIFQEKINRREHRSQNVVEVVRNAADDATHGLHLVRLPKSIDEGIAFIQRKSQPFLRQE